MRKHKFLAILFLLLLVACNTGNSQTSEPPQAAQPTDAAIATRMDATSTVVHTASLPIPTDIPTIANTPTSTVTPFLLTPSPWPIASFIITPNADQLARWQEYEKALATAIFPSHTITDVICEWEILKQLEQRVYVWAICSGYYSPDKASTASLPAVINLYVDASIQSVKTTENTPGSYSDALQELFPMDVQEKFKHYRFGGAKIMFTHIGTRRTTPSPPLFVLLATPMP